MDWIDVAIPGFFGILLLAAPQMFFKSQGNKVRDADRRTTLRRIGMVLIGVAALYLCIRIVSPR